MIAVYKTHQAKIDLLDCWLYIATENSPIVADKVLLKIEKTLAMLSNNPNAGTS